ncbi:MAG: hypothetical protein H0S81_11230 [Desulfotignum balticum]|jgi:hypothetical protein|uniref:Uncharacterized protein n=1 Tax=Desulfotignum balticum TaxID=115781 RepID=A0A931GCL4_9BACT|nr:hypothetical protein [Desulfotignum balticum]
MTDDKEIRDPETEKPEPPEKSGQKISWPWVMGLGAVVVVAAAGVIFWIGAEDRGGTGNSFSSQMTFPVPGIKELRLDDFLIPLTADPAHTGMSFSLVIRYRDSQWSAMSDHEKIWLRAMIYDTLVKQMQKQKKPPSVERVAFWADRTLREIYPDRGLDEVIVDNAFML